MMSKCYSGSLRRNSRKMSLLEERSAVAARLAEEETAEIVPAASHGKKTMGNQGTNQLRKRKKLDALMHVFTLDSASLENKRRRENVQLSTTTPAGAGPRDTSHYRKGGFRDVVNSGEIPSESRFGGNLQSGGLSSSISPLSLSTKKTQTDDGRRTRSGAPVATSAQGSGLANHSTVTTSSSEQEEGGTSLHSSRQTSKVGSEIKDTVNLLSITQAAGTGSIFLRQTGDHDHHGKRAKRAPVHHTLENIRNDKIRDAQRDSEVLSSFSNMFASLGTHDPGANRLSRSRFRDVNCEERSGETEITCVLNSGCSTIDAGKRERARATDYGSLSRQYDESSELILSSCTRELHSSSVYWSPCLSGRSSSIPSGLLTPYQPYRSMGPSRTKESIVLPSRRKSVIVDEILATDSTFATDKYGGKNSLVTPQSSHPPSHAAASNFSDQEAEGSSPGTDRKFSCGLHGGGGQNPAPKFVLSSGRMSKDEASREDLRPSTIDDDFDQYFAQLML